MGRFYLPPQVLVVVAVLAAVGAILLVLARPASGSEQPQGADTASAAVVLPQATLVSAVEPVAEPEPAPAAASPARVPAISSSGPPAATGSSSGRARAGAWSRGSGPGPSSAPRRPSPSPRGAAAGSASSRPGSPTAGSAGSTPEPPSCARARGSASGSTSRRGASSSAAATVSSGASPSPIGRPSSPTPIGRFAVTDKLSGARYSPAYGCCILALSAHQPNLPAGWRGGDRIAVHGTNDPGSIGAAASSGCPRAGAADMRYLLRAVPLGAPVFVRA